MKDNPANRQRAFQKLVGPLVARSERGVERQVTQNPKTVPKEIRVILGRTVLERRKDDAEESSHGGADRSGIAAWLAERPRANKESYPSFRLRQRVWFSSAPQQKESALMTDLRIST
jgi:hypothetical protein